MMLAQHPEKINFYSSSLSEQNNSCLCFTFLPNIFLTTVKVPLCGTQERRHHALVYEAFASFFLCSSQITSHLRAYLKTGNMTNSEGFFACCAPFFRGNTLCIARENGAQQAEKTRCLGVLTVFR